jgi:hypothetical protein
VNAVAIATAKAEATAQANEQRMLQQKMEDARTARLYQDIEHDEYV